MPKGTVRTIRKPGRSKEVQDKLDALLGGKTEYEIFFHGFVE
jgi:hypothetical protein